MNRTPYIFWVCSTFLIAGFLTVNYTLNHFYINGGYMADSGWFAYLSAYSVDWPINNPPSMGGTYFSTHFSPAFYIFSALYTILTAIGIGISDASWFSITQGFWLALAAASTFILLSVKSKQTTVCNIGNSVASLIITFNGVFLASIGFPHFEIAIPALLVTFFAGYINGHQKTAIAFLCLGLLMREDAGLHYFGLFFLLICYLYFAKNRVISYEIRFFAILACICFIYSLLAILIQTIYFHTGNSSLSKIYLGKPALAHISLDFIRERWNFFISNRLYILAPIILGIFLAAYKKSWQLLIGIGAVLPWIVFSFGAISFQAGTLTSYYSFPVAIALFWPAIGYALFSQQHAPTNNQISIKNILALAFVSLGFYVGSEGNHDIAPWKNFQPKWINHIDSTHTSLNLFIQSNSELKFIFDDSAASLFNSTATTLQWKYELAFSKSQIKASDAILFQPGTWLTARVKEVASTAGFKYLCRIPQTHYAVFTRVYNIKNCQRIESIDGDEDGDGGGAT